MGPKRENREDPVGAPTRRKRKAGDTRQGDDANSTRSESPPNSDIMEEPVVHGGVKEDRGSELKSSLDLDEAKITGCDPKPGTSLHEIASSSKSFKGIKLTTTECENFDVTGEGSTNKGKGNSDQSSHSCYWKRKSEELAIEFKKKTWELEADLAYWKGKAKELERNFSEVEAEPAIALRGSQSHQSNCLVTKVQVHSALARKIGNNRFRISKADREMEVDEISSDSVCLVDLTEDRSEELNSNSSQLIGPGKKHPETSGEKSPSPLFCSTTSPESEMTSRDPKRGILHTTTVGSKSCKYQVKVTKCEGENLAPTGTLFDKEVEETFNVNPLLDEYIMEHVLQYIMCQPAKNGAFKDFKNCRQVCKPWKNSATRLYRRTAPVLKFGNYDSDFDLYTFGNLKNFLETMRDSEMVPFRSYEITGSINTYKNQKLMENFLRICGPDMTSVDFRFKKSGTFQGNLDLNDTQQLDLSKLRTLTVDIEDDQSVYNSSEAHAPAYFTGFVLLNATESFREFRLKFTLPYHNNNEAINLTSMQKFEAICQHIPGSVKILDLQMFLTDRTFIYLAENGLSLEEFSVNPSYITGSCEAIHYFLKNQSTHLNVLQMVVSNRNYDNDTLILDFALLEKLETLKLADIHVIPFSIAEKLPNLKCLDLVQWADEENFPEFLECASKTVPSVKKIHLPLCPDFVPFVERISKYFPNITELRLVHDDEHSFSGEYLEQVFTHLRRLEFLHITVHPLMHQEINLDSVFTGVPDVECKRICKGRKFNGVSLAGLPRRPSMLNMTRLRKLVLEKGESQSFHGPVVLTDFSIHFLFLGMGALAELDVFGFTNSTKSMVRQIYLKRLKARLRLKWEVGVREN